VRDLLDAISVIQQGQAERMSAPGRFRVWREGASVMCEIFAPAKDPAPAIPEAMGDIDP
jgi:hypothetical protein